MLLNMQCAGAWFVEFLACALPQLIESLKIHPIMLAQ